MVLWASWIGTVVRKGFVVPAIQVKKCNFAKRRESLEADNMVIHLLLDGCLLFGSEE